MQGRKEHAIPGHNVAERDFRCVINNNCGATHTLIGRFASINMADAAREAVMACAMSLSSSGEHVDEVFQLHGVWMSRRNR